MNANDDSAKVENLQRALSAVGVRRWEASKIWLESIHARSAPQSANSMEGTTISWSSPDLGTIPHVRKSDRDENGRRNCGYTNDSHEKGRRVGQEPDGRANSPCAKCIAQYQLRADDQAAKRWSQEIRGQRMKRAAKPLAGSWRLWLRSWCFTGEHYSQKKSRSRFSLQSRHPAGENADVKARRGSTAAHYQCQTQLSE